jgi:hypothetical protein
MMRWFFLLSFLTLSTDAAVNIFLKEGTIQKLSIENHQYQDVFEKLVKVYEDRIILDNPDFDTNLELDTIVYGFSFDVRKGLGPVKLSAGQSMEFHMKVKDED